MLGRLTARKVRRRSRASTATGRPDRVAERVPQMGPPLHVAGERKTETNLVPKALPAPRKPAA